jgi:Mesyanzhinovviridae DNA helicase
MRTKVLRALRPLDAVAVENAVGPGTPDVEYIGGWLELKYLERWPVRGGPVRVDFPWEQRLWHLRRRRRGGATWLLLRCKSEWLLFDGAVAALYLGVKTLGELLEITDMSWMDGLDEEGLVAWLRRGQSVYVLTAGDEERLKRGLPAG